MARLSGQDIRAFNTRQWQELATIGKEYGYGSLAGAPPTREQIAVAISVYGDACARGAVNFRTSEERSDTRVELDELIEALFATIPVAAATTEPTPAFVNEHARIKAVLKANPLPKDGLYHGGETLEGWANRVAKLICAATPAGAREPATPDYWGDLARPSDIAALVEEIKDRGEMDDDPWFVSIPTLIARLAKRQWASTPQPAQPETTTP